MWAEDRRVEPISLRSAAILLLLLLQAGLQFQVEVVLFDYFVASATLRL